jgi:hypothetical protein
MKHLFLAIALVLSACSGDKEGSTTLPSGSVVSAAAKKPGDHTALGTTISRSSSGACAQEDVGLCGCLPESGWYNDGTTVYDVICCEEVGDMFNLHSCGDNDCEESGSSVMCSGGGGHGG